MASVPNSGDPRPTEPLPWYHLGARVGLLALTFIGCCLVAGGVKYFDGRRQHNAVAALEQVGAEVYYDYQFDRQGIYFADTPAAGPAWLRSWLGDDFFRNVHWVSLSGPQVNDASLANLSGLTHIEWLSIKDTPAVTDAGLDNLRTLTQLGELYLNGTRTTNAGLSKLQKSLPHCRIYK